MQTISNEKNFIYILLVVAIVLTGAVFWPFLAIIILAVAFAVVINPVYKWINRHITKNISWLASLITVLLFFVLLCIPDFLSGKLSSAKYKISIVILLFLVILEPLSKQ